MGIQYNYSIFFSSQCLPIPPATLQVRKRWKRNIQVNGWRNGAPSPCVSFLETRNAQGATFIVSWKRNTRKIWVCFLCFLFPVFRLRPYLHVVHSFFSSIHFTHTVLQGCFNPITQSEYSIRKQKYKRKRKWATLHLDRLRDFVVVPFSAGGNSSLEVTYTYSYFNSFHVSTRNRARGGL